MFTKVSCLIVISLLASCTEYTLKSPEEIQQAIVLTSQAWPTNINLPSTVITTPTSTLTPEPATETPRSGLPFTQTPTFIVLSSSTSLPFPAEAACLPTNTQEQGLVSHVVDGDTIDVIIAGQNYPVRYIGMDTPEDTIAHEIYGPEAARKNRELVEGKAVTLIKDISETDRYDRLLRYVIAGGVFVNYELVRLGFAKAREYPPDISCNIFFAIAQQEAQSHKLGLWGLTPTLVAKKPAKAPAIGICNCTGPDLDCNSFSSRSSAQACFNYCNSLGYGDIFRLDADHDGKVCEK